MSVLSLRNFRLSLLKLCSLTLVGTISYILFKPQQGVFDNFAISNQWEATDSHEIEIHYQKLDKKKYQEKSNNNLKLAVILIPSLGKDVSTLIESHFKFDLEPEEIIIVEDKNIGSYGLFTKDHSTYLSTCIHPHEKSAFSKKEFAKLANHNLRDRIFPWVLGLSDFRDWRCFWVNISVDLQDITELEATKLLPEKLAHIISQSKF